MLTEENHQGDRVVYTTALLGVYGELSKNATSHQDVQNLGLEQRETA